jgi:hypothetical protein
MEVAKAIRELPTQNLNAKRQARFQPTGSVSGMLEMLTDFNDPKTRREMQRERAEEERAKRTERRANVAIIIAAVGAVGSIIVGLLH